MFESLKGFGVTFGTMFKKVRSEEHTSELQSQSNLVCRLLLEKKKYAPARHRSTYQVQYIRSISGVARDTSTCPVAMPRRLDVRALRIIIALTPPALAVCLCVA